MLFSLFSHAEMTRLANKPTQSFGNYFHWERKCFSNKQINSVFECIGKPNRNYHRLTGRLKDAMRCWIQSKSVFKLYENTKHF